MHGNKYGLVPADGKLIEWSRLAQVFKNRGAPDVVSLSACAVLCSSRLPDALSEVGLDPWLIGPSDPEGVNFDDACVAFMAFYKVLSAWRRERKGRYRPLSTLRSDKIMMRNALDRMHGSSDGDFRYYRWSGSRGHFVYNDRDHSARRIADQFADTIS
jgi:hypothetical protein